MNLFPFFFDSHSIIIINNNNNNNYYYYINLTSKASPQWGGGRKTSYCLACPYVVYIYRYICAYVHNPGGEQNILRTQLKKGNDCCGKQAMEVTVSDEENDCRFEVQRDEPWIHTRPTWPIAVKERLLELFCD